jgi:SAM-dependent methyltransferase
MPSASAIRSFATPRVDLDSLADVLACPDDGARLRNATPVIACEACGRRFAAAEDGVMDLRPLKPAALPASAERNTSYWREYASEFAREYAPDPKAIAWGAPEASSTEWLQKRLRQVQAMRPLVADSKFARSQVFCDIAAGAGHYTLAYAPAFQRVLHCDLSVENLSYAARKAAQLGIRNVAFLRVDYFSPPFRRSLDRIVCCDTLIRGERHEEMLLGTIRASLKPGGRAVVDFHNWWHNPLRRVGLLPQNFGTNRSYARREAEKLLRAAGASDFEYFPFHQEFLAGARSGAIVASVIPPTRLVYRFGGEVRGANADQHPVNSSHEEFHVAQL